MRIKEAYKRTGEFWIPSNKQNKVHGTLFIKDGGEIELETTDILSNNDYIKRIFGHIEQDGLITLDECYTRNHRFSHGIIKNIFRVDRAFLGVHYEEQEDTCFNSFCFSIERLHEWVGIRGVTIDSSSEYRHFNIQYKQPKEIHYKIKDIDMQLIFQFNNYSRSGHLKKDAFTTLITEKTHIDLVSPKKLSLEDFISIARKITNFICFAINNVVCINDATVISNEIKDEKGNPISIKLYYRSRPFAKNTDGRKAELFSYYYDEVKQNMEKIINNWISISDKIYPAFELYLSTQEAEHQFLESKFLTLIQALEAYHQRELCTDDIPLKKRIEEVMYPFKRYIGNDEICEKVIESIKDTRVYFTHYNPKRESKAMRGTELYALCLILEGLFQLTLLKKLGISDQRIDFIATQILKYKFKNKLISYK